MSRLAAAVYVMESPAQIRERLILEHLPQVRLIARRIHERLPQSINLDDLISAGTLGLIAAIDRFDPEVGVKLKTYAEHKIRGAILDTLRSMDWAPRQQRRRAKQVEAAILAVEQRLQRSAAEDEIAQELGIPLAEYQEWLFEIRSLRIGSLEANVHGDEKRDLMRFVADSEDSWPSEVFQRREIEAVLADCVRKLPANEKTVLSLYFAEDLTLREIAKVVGLHESRVSQIKTQALLRLRTTIKRQWPELVERQYARAAAH
jgi:RNA polymerase sigma factor FliA